MKIIYQAATIVAAFVLMSSFASAQTPTNTATPTSTATPTPTNTPTPTATATSTASGAVVVTSTTTGLGIVRYDFAWTSSAGGTVNGNQLGVVKGYIYQMQAVPGGLGGQPTNAYSLVLNDPYGVDLLGGGGTALSNSTSKLFQILPPLLYDGGHPGVTIGLDLVVSGAGASKQGTLTIWTGSPWRNQ